MTDAQRAHEAESTIADVERAHSPMLPRLRSLLLTRIQLAMLRAESSAVREVIQDVRAGRGAPPTSDKAL